MIRCPSLCCKPMKDAATLPCSKSTPMPIGATSFRVTPSATEVPCDGPPKWHGSLVWSKSVYVGWEVAGLGRSAMRKRGAPTWWKARLLIADEPTTALDVTTQAQILK